MPLLRPNLYLDIPLAVAGWVSLSALACTVRAQVQAEPEGVVIRFGMTADAHLLGRRSPQNEALFKGFVDEMVRWRPDFAIDLGDFACQAGEDKTTQELHDAQLSGLVHHMEVFARVPCPHYNVVGNHDVGWIKGGDEEIEPAVLLRRSHGGEDITKAEFVAATGIPSRHYSFDCKGVHFIVLDGCNAADATCPPRGRDGVNGGYFVDGPQKAWLARDLAAHRDQLKVVFSHQELHHTPESGSDEGGDVPFPAVGKETSYIDNGWEIREMLAADGKVVACFAAHKHRNRWTVHGGVNYITLAATHWGGSFAKVTISDALRIEGAGEQRDYELPLPGR